MPLNRKASILFLISVVLYVGLSLIVSLGMANTVNENTLYLLNSLVIQIPAFLIPAVFFRRTNRFKIAPMPHFGQIVLAIVIGIGCIFMNEALTFLNNAALFGVEFETNSTSAETILGMPAWNMVLSLAIVPPICEEFMMRGALLEAWRRYSPVWAAILTSLLFALLHMAPSYFIVYVGIGLLLAIVYLITRNVWLTVLIHLVNNLASVLAALSASGAGSDAAQTAQAAEQSFIEELMNTRSGLLILTVFYGVFAAAVLVPAVIGLKNGCKRRGEGMFAIDADSFLPRKKSKDPLDELYNYNAEAPVLTEETAVGELEKPNLFRDAVLWIVLGLLILMNVAAALGEFGIV